MSKPPAPLSQAVPPAVSYSEFRYLPPLASSSSRAPLQGVRRGAASCKDPPSLEWLSERKARVPQRRQLSLDHRQYQQGGGQKQVTAVTHLFDQRQDKCKRRHPAGAVTQHNCSFQQGSLPETNRNMAHLLDKRQDERERRQPHGDGSLIEFDISQAENGSNTWPTCSTSARMRAKDASPTEAVTRLKTCSAGGSVAGGKFSPNSSSPTCGRGGVGWVKHIPLLDQAFGR